MMEKPRRIFKPCDAHDKNMRWQRYFNLDHYHYPNDYGVPSPTHNAG